MTGADDVLPLDPGAIGELTRVTVGGDVALFPAEGVYGLAADPRHPEAVDRMARLKDRDPGKPSAVLFWALDDALSAVASAGEDVATAMRRLLPGPIGVLVPDPDGRFPAAAGDAPGTLGVRVPLLASPVDAPPVVQTSANRAGGPDAATVADVPEDIRAGCGLVLDRGRRPGRPSTLVDLRGLGTSGGRRRRAVDGRDDEAPAGRWRIVREGAVVRDAIVAALVAFGPPAP